jgi:hypothetical protein
MADWKALGLTALGSMALGLTVLGSMAPGSRAPDSRVLDWKAPGSRPERTAVHLLPKKQAANDLDMVLQAVMTPAVTGMQGRKTLVRLDCYRVETKPAATATQDRRMLAQTGCWKAATTMVVTRPVQRMLAQTGCCKVATKPEQKILVQMTPAQTMLAPRRQGLTMPEQSCLQNNSEGKMTLVQTR